MKLPVSVLMEALTPLGNWQFAGDDASARYAFPRRYDAAAGCAGHAVVLFPGEPSAPKGDWLAVHTRPDATVPQGVNALIPDTSVDGTSAMDRLAMIYDRMDIWAEALDKCSADLSGVQEMLVLSAGEMGGSFGLIDESYNMPAHAGGFSSSFGIRSAYGGTMRPDDESIIILAADPQITAVRSVHGVQSYEDYSREGTSLFRNMFRPGEEAYFNRLLFARPSSVYTQTDYFMLEYLADRIERITRNLSTFSMPVSRFDALKQMIRLAAAPGDEPIHVHFDALSPIGWKRDDTFRFYLFHSVYDRRDAGVNEYLVRRLEQLIPGSCGVVDEGRILLVQNTRYGKVPFRELRSRLAEFLRENMYKAGISNEVTGIERLRGAFLQSQAAIELGTAHDPMFWYYLFEDYLCAYLLHKAAEDIPADMLMPPAVEALRRCDEERGTHFVETLRSLSVENFNVTHAAQRLFIHRTSLQDRMDRIRTLTDLDLEDTETRFLLHFGFRLTEGK